MSLLLQISDQPNHQEVLPNTITSYHIDMHQPCPYAITQTSLSMSSGGGGRGLSDPAVIGVKRRLSGGGGRSRARERFSFGDVSPGGAKNRPY